LAIAGRPHSVGLVLAAATIWGSSFVVIKLGLDAAPPATSAWLRFAIAAAASTAVAPLVGGLRPAVLKHPLVLAISAVNAVGFLFQYLGLAETNSAVAALLANMGVVVVALLAVRWLGERPTAMLLIAVGCAFAGGTLLATRGDPAALSTPGFRGALLVAVASFVWSLFVVLGKVALDRKVATEAELSWAVLVLSALFLAPAALSLEGAPDLAALPAGAWGAALYTGVVCSSLSFVLYLRGLSRLSATATAVLTVGEILVAFALTAVVFGYVVSGVEAVGAGLVLGAISLASLSRPAARPAPPPPPAGVP
jgi:drug/metabolite transporter (DMT)-like permease